MFPIQPIKEGRFVPNRIVTLLLDSGTIDMNELARRDFTQDERVQFAQLIGYSLSGFSELSYVNDETYNAAVKITDKGMNEVEARNEAMRNSIKDAKEGVNQAAVALFGVHPEDLKYLGREIT